MRETHETWLKTLTQLPTAAGCEQRVVRWIEQWAAKCDDVSMRRDRFGNVMLARRGVRAGRPIIFAAHMDHPAFVVTEVEDARHVIAAFRGGVRESYFLSSPVRLHHGADKPARGRVEAFVERKPAESWGGDDSAKRLRISFTRDVAAAVGYILTWDVGRARIVKDRLRAPACDDLAGVAAALAAFDAYLAIDDPISDIRVLLTLAEEVGFVGAIAACGSGIIPKTSRIIALENSKSFAESPIGAGPIVRVGDFTSIFNADLTYRISRIAQGLADEAADFRWQRKLMPGGTCEASAYQEYGYAATCLCLPLGNYHNMNERTGRIAAETISVRDFHGLVKLLEACGARLDDAR